MGREREREMEEGVKGYLYFFAQKKSLWSSKTRSVRTRSSVSGKSRVSGGKPRALGQSEVFGEKLGVSSLPRLAPKKLTP
jgi:hypothetical protein